MSTEPEQSQSIRIPLSGRLTAGSFEALLFKYLTRSKKAGLKTIEFDMSKLEFCEPVCLAMLTCWKRTLQDKSRLVRWRLPSGGDVPHFLEQYGFNDWQYTQYHKEYSNECIYAQRFDDQSGEHR